jgi:hypothetical protein
VSMELGRQLAVLEILDVRVRILGGEIELFEEGRVGRVGLLDA